MTTVRAASHLDCDAINALHLEAFPEEENTVVAKLAVDLLTERTEPEVLSLVSELDSVITGHIAFSPVYIEGKEEWRGYILAPLGVAPEHHARGVGSSLVKAGLEQLNTMGVNSVIVYGDPEYYGRFGFSADVGKRYLPPYKLEYPFGWQALELKEGAEGPSGRKISCVASLSKPELW